MTLPERDEYERPLAGCAKSLAITVGVAVAVVLICLTGLWAVGWGAT